MTTFTDLCHVSGRKCVDGTCARTGQTVTVLTTGLGGAVIRFTDGHETYASRNELTETP